MSLTEADKSRLDSLSGDPPGDPSQARSGASGSLAQQPGPSAKENKEKGERPMDSNQIPGAETKAEPGLVAQLRELYEDGRALVDAELGFHKQRMQFVGAQAKMIGILFFLALIGISSALLALIIGSMIALASLLGGWGAMAATVAFCLLLTGLCVLLAIRRIKAVRRLFDKEEIRKMELSRRKR